MKTKIPGRFLSRANTSGAIVPAILLVLTSCSSTPKPPPDVGSARIEYTKGVPGGVIVQTFKTIASVTAIDRTKRTATLLGSDGKKFTVNVGPEAVNFDQVRVGDRISATVVQKIVASIDQQNTTAGDGAAVGVARAPQGGQPGGLIAATAQVTAKVTAIDPVKRTATLRLEDGTTQTITIRDDVDLSRHHVGEQVDFRITEMIAIGLEKP